MKFKTLHILGSWIEICTCTQNWHSLQDLNEKRIEIELGSKKRVIFFSRWCLNLFVIFIKKTYHIKIKKTNKQNKETDILENKKRGTEKDRHLHAIKNCLTICEEFVHGYGYYESCLEFRPWPLTWSSVTPLSSASWLYSATNGPHLGFL